MLIFSILKVLAFCFLGYILYRFALLPWIRSRFYKKQGLMVEYFPLIGSFLTKMQSSLKKHNDSLYDLKLLAMEKPNVKALVRNLGSNCIVLLLDPALKKEAAFHHDHYELPNFFGDFGKFFMRGLIGVNGDEWKKQRKIISQSFHFEFLKSNVPLMVSTTRQLLEETSLKNLDGIHVLKEIENIAGENIGRIFFSENLKEYQIKGRPVTAHLMHVAVQMAKCFISVGYMLFGAKYIEKGLFKAHRELVEDIKLLEETCTKMLAERRKAQKNAKDLAWYLLESQKNPVEEDRLSDETIISNYVAFIAAGTNTTTHLVSMTLYALTQNPEALEKLKEEIKEIYNTEDIISLDSLGKMNWLTALLKETLRIYNPVGTGSGFRRAIKDHKIGDVEIKKGTTVSASFIHTHFSPEYFENPWEYQPKRWIDRPNLNETYAFTPFWAGPRNCIGQHLALIEAKIILCEFVKKFDFQMIKDYKLKLGNRQAYGPMDDLPMNLKIRENNLYQN